MKEKEQPNVEKVGVTSGPEIILLDKVIISSRAQREALVDIPESSGYDIKSGSRILQLGSQIVQISNNRALIKNYGMSTLQIVPGGPIGKLFSFPQEAMLQGEELDQIVNNHANGVILEGEEGEDWLIAKDGKGIFIKQSKDLWLPYHDNGITISTTEKNSPEFRKQFIDPFLASPDKAPKRPCKILIFESTKSVKLRGKTYAKIDPYPRKRIGDDMQIVTYMRHTNGDICSPSNNGSYDWKIRFEAVHEKGFSSRDLENFKYGEYYWLFRFAESN